MKTVSKGLDIIVRALKWIGMICMVAVMLVITIGVISRLLGTPILGSMEMAEIIHYVLIMCSFAYTQSLREHISIGLLVDRFSPHVQVVFDKISYLIGFTICMIISYVFIVAAFDANRTTLLLGFPHNVLKWIAFVGFMAWGMVNVQQLFAKPEKTEKGGLEDV
ncbi:TRAP transporter small permease [Aquibacillus sediminis]|uniref:TRAP transporter small permease n=1 Tax=Aquibacillus sediminis TaxID=2574734 RepID=UPI001109C69F|nr:TRAP transporter small permease [Aquibacillus sediminis]